MRYGTENPQANLRVSEPTLLGDSLRTWELCPLRCRCGLAVRPSRKASVGNGKPGGSARARSSLHHAVVFEKRGFPERVLPARQPLVAEVAAQPRFCTQITSYACLPDRAVPCRAVPCRAVPCQVMPCQAMSRHAKLCHVMACHSKPHQGMAWHGMARHGAARAMPKSTGVTFTLASHTACCNHSRNSMLRASVPGTAPPRRSLKYHHQSISSIVPNASQDKSAPEITRQHKPGLHHATIYTVQVGCAWPHLAVLSSARHRMCMPTE